MFKGSRKCNHLRNVIFIRETAMAVIEVTAIFIYVKDCCAEGK